MTPEQKFWQLLKPHVPGHVVRIENSIASGIPDVNYCYNGQERWIELKAGSHIRASQTAWHRLRGLYGGIVYVFDRKGDEIHISREGVTIFIAPKPFNWQAIEALLKGQYDNSFKSKLNWEKNA